MAGTQQAEQLVRSLAGAAIGAGGLAKEAAVRRSQSAAHAVLTTADETLTAVLRRVADAALTRIDTTALVRDHVDLDALVAGVDVDAVINRVDLLALATYIIDGIDLTTIIRQSTGGVTADALRGARLRSYEADQTVARVVDRVLLRHRARETQGANGLHPDVGP